MTANRNISQIITIYFFAKYKTTRPPNKNSQNQSQLQNQNLLQQASQSVFLTINHKLN